ncbi:hypothetical protein BZG36_03259 [Bifiguratus adelaidae]|uniref:Peptidase M11 gametolysin domain-containing protein n=1 Tax=Bifiguratus adelaidae TaxID=1938954 RepID=A0A261XXD7_9FUNG|nr:hypothetical protein BZG36_03259 [Bifiguratus adelaidae]
MVALKGTRLWGLAFLLAIAHGICAQAKAAGQAYRVLAAFKPENDLCEVLEEGPYQFRRDILERSDRSIIKTFRPRYHSEPRGHGVSEDTEQLVEIYCLDRSCARRALYETCSMVKNPAQQDETMNRFGFQCSDGTLVMDRTPVTEVRKIIDNGPPQNRIDVVFMGDGYVLSEKEKFFEDIERLAREMFVGDTYQSTLPLYNIWAVYVESNESGVGVNHEPLDTAFGLVRDGTELRGIYCTKVREAREACKLTGPDACDFPSLIGNSDYYGGLGGEFTISTRSKTSGTVVLRHEMGHNFVNVGEEYDGGWVYSGVNAARSLEKVKWKHWLTSELRAEENAMLVQDYSWYDLANGPYKLNFTSTGGYERWMLQISASGVETDGSFEAYLDGEPLPWNTTGNLDRAFTVWERHESLKAGDHHLEFRGTAPATKDSPIRQLCSTNMHEFPSEDKYISDSSHISAYPSRNYAGRVSYRPTNEGCLMRNMSHPTLCPICVEGLWMQHLAKVTLIDNINVHCNDALDDTTQAQSTCRISLEPVPLAQFRKGKGVEGERYLVTWYKDGIRQADLDDSFAFNGTRSDLWGEWKVRLEYLTPEIRVDPKGLTTAKEKFEIRQYGGEERFQVRSW